MRSPLEIEAEIDAVSDERRAMQRAGVRGRAAEVAQRLEELYCELRESKAALKYGTRESIAQQARIERELEKVSRQAATA